MKGRFWLWIQEVVLVAVLLVACSTGGRPVDAPQVPLAFTVSASEYGFTPAVLMLPAMQPVELTLMNTGCMEHDLVIIAGPGIPTPAATMAPMSGMDATMTGMGPFHVHAQPGKAATLMLTLSAGEYSFICSMTGHRAKGMVGTLIVR
jgi:uncharacterized cupredoxin-like copper-binding protein